MPELIEPRVLKGFRDYLPDAEIERKLLVERLESAFRAAGFVPIDTPVLEYAEILFGKGGGETEKQVYRFKDNGDRDVAMRFDLTVPFARFMAEHSRELYLPFKRYHIAKVWRAENTQRGRYREFMQCDFDFVGSDSAGSDFEILATMDSSMRALGVDRFKIRFSHRGLFNKFLDMVGLREKSVEILRTVDKMGKIGEEETRKILSGLAGETAADSVLSFIKGGDSFEGTLSILERLSGGPGEESERLKILMGFLRDSGIAENFVLDPSITRGLDYYTGIVFETFLDDLRELGSVCSGGRYNDLASLYTKDRLPGVGASVGLDRLLAGLDALGKSFKTGGFTSVIVLCTDESLVGKYHAVAKAFREAGIACEVFPERKKLPAQFAFAEKKSIPFAVSFGPEESAQNVLSLKDLSTRETTENLNVSEAVARVKTALDK